MKKLFVFLLLASAFAACEDEDVNACTTPAVITGRDAAMCACCGGLFVEIDSSTYRLNDLDVFSMESIDSMLQASGPVNVNINWALDTLPCMGNEIVVSCLTVE